MRFWVVLFLLLLPGLAGWGGKVWAQVPVSPPYPPGNQVSKRLPPPDSLTADTVGRNGIAPANVRTDSVQLGRRDSASQGSDLETTVFYQAEDSIVFVVGKKLARLYGGTSVKYGDINLDANQIEVDWTTGILNAQQGLDTNGKAKEVPLFVQGSSKYQSRKLRYNFRTRKGYISEVITQQGEGYLHGETVKREDEKTLFVRNAEYTTCNLEHPHFYIKSYKMKMIPGKKLLSGPFNLHIADVPTPLGFAFGFFPIPQYKSSGIIIPTYGESNDRGFFLRNGGYYLALSKYFDIKLLGEIYTRGGWGFYPQSDYRVRYKFDGNVRFFYNRRVYDREGRSNLEGEDFEFNWNHTPQTKGNSRFSAAVRLMTNTNNQRNAFIPANYFSTTSSSNINYSRTFPNTPFNLNVSGRVTQNFRAKTIEINLPDLAFNMNRIYPFRRKNSTGSKWYEQITVAYTLNARSTINNAVSSQTYSASGVRFIAPTVAGDTVLGTGGTQRLIPFTRDNLGLLLSQARVGAQHTIPISTTLRLFRFFTLTPGINYTEAWYPQRLRFTYEPERNGVIVDTMRGFNRTYDFSGGASLSTQIYGTFFIKRGRLEAIRHRLNPSVSFNYRPDFTSNAFGFTQEVQVDNTPGQERFQRLNPYLNSVYTTGLSPGRQGNIGFSLSNSFEMKLRDVSDSGEVKFTKKSLIDNLSLAGGYNLAADSFNLSPLVVSLNTRLFDIVTLALSGNFDPYYYEDRPLAGREGFRNEVRRPDYAWNNGGGLGRLTSANLSMGFNLNPAANKKKSLPEKKLSETAERELDFINANPAMFVDFTIPWSLAVQYNANYSRLTQGPKRGQFNQNAQISSDISLSPKWKVGVAAPYDFQAKKFAATTLNIYRDLHCWEMRMFVQFSSFRPMYTFDINVKASILQDLKLSKRNSFYDR